MSTSLPSAAALTPAQRANQRNAVLAGFLGWTLDAFDYFVLTFVIEDVARAFGKTRPDIAWTITLTLMMRPVGAIVFGLMADRWGRRLPLMLNVVFYAVISVLSGLAPSYRTFLILRMLFGIGMGGEWGTGAALALESVSSRWRGLFSGLLQEGYALGGFLAALAFRVVYVPLHAANPDQAWRYMFFIGGIPALLSLFIRAKVKESDAWHEHRTDWATYRRSLPAHWRRFLYLVLLMTMMNFSSHGTQDLYPTFLEKAHGYSPQRRAMLNAFSMVGAVSGGIVFGFLSDRIGRRIAMVIALVLACGVVPVWAFSTSTALLWAGGFLIQFMVQGAWGIIPAHISELSPDSVRGFLPGFAYQCGVLIAGTAPLIQSSLAERVGGSYAKVMAITAFIVFSLAAIVTALGRERRGEEFGVN